MNEKKKIRFNGHDLLDRAILKHGLIPDYEHKPSFWHQMASKQTLFATKYDRKFRFEPLS